MNRNNLSTTFDSEIYINLNIIEGLLKDHLVQTGKVTFEMDGHFTDAFFSDWDFHQSSRAEMSKRKQDIITLLDEMDGDFDYSGNEWIIGMLSNKLKRFKSDKEKQGEAGRESKKSRSRQGTSQGLLQEFIRAFSPGTGPGPERKPHGTGGYPANAGPSDPIGLGKAMPSKKAQKTNNGLACDPLLLSYYYIRETRLSPSLKESGALKNLLGIMADGDNDFDELIVNVAEYHNIENFSLLSKMFLDKTGSQDLVVQTIAEYDLYKEILYTTPLPHYDDALSLFMNDFLCLWLPRPNIKPLASLSWDGKAWNNPDIKRSLIEHNEELIINFPAYLSYKAAMAFLTEDSSNKFWSYNLPFSTIVSQDFTKQEVILSELMSFISLRLELFDRFFEDIIDKAMGGHPASCHFKSPDQFIGHLLKYFGHRVEGGDGPRYAMFQNIKFPSDISGLISQCFIQILKGKLAFLDGTSHQFVLLPHEYEKLEETTQLGAKVEMLKKSRSKALPDHFEKSKIRWDDEGARELTAIFSQLYLKKNKDGKPYMSENDVDHLLIANFSCFPDYFTPIPLIFNGHESILRYFVYKLFERDTKKLNKKQRYAQFLIQNFEVFCNCGQTEDQFKVFSSNMKNNKPKRFEVIEA